MGYSSSVSRNTRIPRNAPCALSGWSHLLNASIVLTRAAALIAGDYEGRRRAGWYCNHWSKNYITFGRYVFTSLGLWTTGAAQVYLICVNVIVSVRLLWPPYECYHTYLELLQFRVIVFTTSNFFFILFHCTKCASVCVCVCLRVLREENTTLPLR